MHELHRYCSEPKPDPPPYPKDTQEVEDALHILKALAPFWEVALDNPAPPPPPNPCRPRPHSNGHNTCPISRWHLQHSTSPSVSLYHICLHLLLCTISACIFCSSPHLLVSIALHYLCEAGYIIYLVHLRCQPFRDAWYLQLAHIV